MPEIAHAESGHPTENELQNETLGDTVAGEASVPSRAFAGSVSVIRPRGEGNNDLGRGDSLRGIQEARGSSIVVTEQNGRKCDVDSRCDQENGDLALAEIKNYVKNEQVPIDDRVFTYLSKPGGFIDCVLVQNQPSVRRIESQMGDYEVESPPAEDPDNSSEGEEQKELNASASLCPRGTVPIPRLTVERVAKSGSLDAFLAKTRRVKPIDPNGSGAYAIGHEYAKVDIWQNIRGAKGNFNIWSPFVASSGEFSLVQTWIVRGNDSDKQTLEAGLQVYEDLYDDRDVHLFIYSTRDGYENSVHPGCYNNSCNDFVQTSNAYTIGGAWSTTSSTGGAQYTIELKWYRSRTGNWWLAVGNRWMSYYPRHLFDQEGLASNADRASFGGEIYSSSVGSHTHTDMGSGAFANLGWQQAAFVANIETRATGSNTFATVPISSTYVTDSSCYSVEVGPSGSSWGTYFYYGGSGKNSSCP